MTALVCNKCKTQWDSGFLGNTLCPACNKSVLPGIGRFIKYLIKTAALFAAVTGGVLWLYQDRIHGNEQMLAFVKRLYTFPDVFVYGPAGFASSLDDMQLPPGTYSVLSATPAYAKPLSDHALEAAQPLLTLPAGHAVHVLELRRDRHRVWLSAEVRVDDALKRVYLPLPMQWQDSLGNFDLMPIRKAQVAAFLHDIDEQFEVKHIAYGLASRKFAKNNPNWNEFGRSPDGRVLFVQNGDMARIYGLRDYYLSNASIAEVALQTDPQYKRPAFTAPQTSGDKHD